MTYEPRPIETGHVRLPESLGPLLEELAEHNHDVWARGRIAEGWTYGPVRDDKARHHPDLIPYADLPEGEKQYDRDTATQILKAIIALGYRIEEGSTGRLGRSQSPSGS